MTNVRRACVFGMLSLALAGCSATDLQLEPRAGTINQETDSARNNEILLNIVRASRSQPLNFVPISKASGTQTTDLKVGLPTLTLGPAQTAMQRQVAFGGNVWDNSLSGSFDTAPLSTHDFYSNMLSPIDLQTVNALIRQGFSRELVLNAVIGSIRVKGPDGSVLEIVNDPLLDPGEPTCPSARDYYGSNRIVNRSPYSLARVDGTSPLMQCKFHLFEFLLQAAMAWGINVETKSEPNPAYTPDAVKAAKTAGKDPPAKTITQSRFCFDPAFAVPSQQSYVLKVLPDYCGASKAWSKGGEGNDLTVIFEDRGRRSAPSTFTIIPRSPFAMFRYFGHVLRAEETTQVRLYWRDGGVGEDDDRVLGISRTVLPLCFAKAFYFGSFYCVPYEGNDATKQVFAMLNQIVALSTTTGSLPTTLEVRLQ